MPAWAQAAWDWFLPDNFADLTGIIGIFVTLGGFIVALRRIRRSKEAVDRAEQAVRDAVKELRLFDAVTNFNNAISMMEEIKNRHREDTWVVERYSALRKILISIRTGTPNLTEPHQIIIQAAIQHMGDFEKLAGRSRDGKPVPPKLNELISNDVDKMYEILLSLKGPTVR